jgi:anti-sigma regulatory factor (Ser/Thr protein kinase)
VAPGERVVLSSDGAHEAVNASGERFGPARFDRAASHGAVPGLGVVGALDAFLAGEPASDDVSVVEISLTQKLFEPCSTPARAARAPVQPGAGGEWRIALDLHADALRMTDPVPMVLAQLQQIPGLEPHRPMLYTVLSELYRNALEHGVLQLDSKLKDLPEGFERYVVARERGLAELTTGSIRLSVTCVQARGGGHLTIRVEDSGPGFDWAALPPAAPSGAHGRGLHLVRALCSALTFERGGRCALATYAWGEAGRCAA